MAPFMRLQRHYDERQESEVVAKTVEDILILQAAIRQLHKCDATHHKTVFVDEKFQGKTIWSGEVEVFELRDHPKAASCFAWMHEEEGKDQRPIVLLERWPVSSPRTAVQAAIAFGFPNLPLGGDQPGAATV